MTFKTMFRVASAASLMAVSGCAGLDQATADFQKVWETPRVDVSTASSTEALAAAPADRLAALKASLATLQAPSGCSEIEATAPRVLTSDETHFDSIVLLAECAFHDQNYAGARHYYMSAERHQRHPRILRGLGMTALKSGDFEGSLQYFADLQQTEAKPDWKSFNAMGYAHDRLAAYEEAETYYWKAADLAPGEPAPLNNLGMSYLGREMFAEAVEAFRLANDRAPRNRVVELNLRIAMAMNGKLGPSLAGADDQQRAAVYNSVGVYASSKGDLERARELFTEALESSSVFFPSAYENLEQLQFAGDQPGATLRQTLDK